jgi:hypothetical protein
MEIMESRTTVTLTDDEVREALCEYAERALAARSPTGRYPVLDRTSLRVTAGYDPSGMPVTLSAELSSQPTEGR